MKRQLVLRVESEEKEEYVWEIKNNNIWSSILYSLFDATKSVTNKVKKEILLNTSDEIPHSVAVKIESYTESDDIDRIYATELIRWAFSSLTCNLNYEELESIYQKVKEDSDAQMAMIAYCWEKKKVRMLKKFASEGINEKVRYEAASYFEE